MSTATLTASHARRLPGTCALLVAAATLAIGLAWGTFAAGGSDSYCYVSQADAWLDGSLLRPQRFDFEPTWPDATLTLTPAGYVPSTHRIGAIAPICPAGLGLTMAAANAMGGARAVYAVVPVLGALLIWSTFLLGRHLGGAWIGLAAAIWMATSPILLYQVVQPMSDVPAAAWWTLALSLAPLAPRLAGIGTGLAVSMAILTRPNLAPLSALVLAIAWAADANSGWRARLWRQAWIAAGLVPGLVVAGIVQTALYGSPFASGYGSLGGLFSLSHVWPNVQRYPVWLVQTQTPVVALAALAPLTQSRHPRHTWLIAFFALAAIAAYLPYTVFDDWWYLRFLLPALPALLVLALVALRALTARVAGRATPLLLVVLVLAVATTGVRIARDRQAFRLAAGEQRFVAAGRAVDTRLPAAAVVLAGFHSGNVRLYGRRPTVVWDVLPPDWLDRAVNDLARQGHGVYLVLESWEEPLFRDRFSAFSAFGALDWPPLARVGNAVRIYAAADRDRYHAGERVSTEIVPVVQPHRRR